MTALEIVVKAAGLRTLWLGVASVTAGTAAAAAHGNVEIIPAILCLLFMLFGQATSNVIHRYFDEKYQLGENVDDGIHAAEDVDRPVSYILREGVKIFGIVAAMVGLALLGLLGLWTVIIAILIALVAFLNNAGRSGFSRSPFYPLSTFVVFGPLAVIGTELAQSQRISEDMLNWWDIGPAVVFSLVIGLMAMNSHILYGAFHRRTNRRSMRTTFYGRYGRKGAMTVLTVSSFLYASIAIWAPISMQLHPWWIFLPVAVISLLFSLFIIFFMLKPGTWKMAWNLSLVNMMFVAVSCLVICCIIGYPYATGDSASAF